MSGCELSYPAYTISGSMFSSITVADSVSPGDTADMIGTIVVFVETEVSFGRDVNVASSFGLCTGGC